MLFFLTLASLWCIPGESKVKFSLFFKLQKLQSPGVAPGVCLKKFKMASSSDSSEAEDFEKFAIITDIVNSGKISWSDFTIPGHLITALKVPQSTNFSL